MELFVVLFSKVVVLRREMVLLNLSESSQGPLDVSWSPV